MLTFTIGFPKALCCESLGHSSASFLCSDLSWAECIGVLVTGGLCRLRRMDPAPRVLHNLACDWDCTECYPVVIVISCFMTYLSMAISTITGSYPYNLSEKIRGCHSVATRVRSIAPSGGHRRLVWTTIPGELADDQCEPLPATGAFLGRGGANHHVGTSCWRNHGMSRSEKFYQLSWCDFSPIVGLVHGNYHELCQPWWSTCVRAIGIMMTYR